MPYCKYETDEGDRLPMLRRRRGTRRGHSGQRIALSRRGIMRDLRWMGKSKNRTDVIMREIQRGDKVRIKANTFSRSNWYSEDGLYGTSRSVGLFWRYSS